MITMMKPYIEVAPHRGVMVRVPWVAQWTGEVRDDAVTPYEADGQLAIKYDDEAPDDRVLDALWMRTGADRTGQPQFAQFNIYRQRTAMWHGLCQVCGLPAKGSWLIPPIEKNRGPIRTATPPTCETCVPIARRQCPHLAGAGQHLDVANYRQFAIWGDVFEFQHGRIAHYQSEYRLGDPRIRTNLLARQLVVEIYDYRRKRESSPRSS